jgi:hypothetical protein
MESSALRNLLCLMRNSINVYFFYGDLFFCVEGKSTTVECKFPELVC